MVQYQFAVSIELAPLAIVIAGIPQAPSVYSPDNSQELADQRAEQVLNSMRECGYLS